MESLPLTRSQPYEDVPAGIEPLFPELAPPGLRPVEVTVALPGVPCAMHVVIAQADVLRALALASEACAGVEEFEITARRFRG
jgi:hypothetical protein